MAIFEETWGGMVDSLRDKPETGLLSPGSWDAARYEQERAEQERLEILEAKLAAERERIANESEAQLLELVSAELAEVLAERRLTAAQLMVHTADFGEFRRWCFQGGLEPLPAHPTSVGRFLAERAIEGTSLARLEELAAAISIAHRRYLGDDDPTSDPLVSATLRYLHKAKPDDDGGGHAPPPTTDPAAGEMRKQTAAA